MEFGGLFARKVQRIPQLSARFGEILCVHYGEVGGFWFDGDWLRKEADWKEDRLYAMIRRHQPEAIIINNLGIGAEGALGHAEVDSTTFE